MTREEKEDLVFANLYDLHSRGYSGLGRIKTSLELTHVFLHKYGHLIDYEPQFIGSGETHNLGMGVYPADMPIEQVAANIFAHNNFIHFAMKPVFMFLVKFEQDMMKDGKTIMHVYGYFR